MATKRIEQWEVERYWEIFSSLANGGSHLDGAAAATVLKNSQLRDDQLERIWDLADVDNDGKLDFEEFCVAMRLIFDLVNGEYADVPNTLPDWLVPESKVHLVQASRALSGSQPSFERPGTDSDDDSDGPGLSSNFDWYMSPSDKSKYEEIYTSARSAASGEVFFEALEDLYASLDNVPDTDVRSAWNLVNPSARSSIGKDACLAFLHVLNSRNSGTRLPRSVPPSLRASFERGNIDYNLDSAGSGSKPNSSRWATSTSSSTRDSDTTTARKAKFGDAYLTRLGVGDRAALARGTKGTDFSSSGGSGDSDWELVRLKRQLRELDEKMEKVEAASSRNRNKSSSGVADRSKPALVRRELEQLLEYKRRELRDTEEGAGRAAAGKSLAGVRDEIALVREQVEGLEQHWRRREGVLEGLRREVEAERLSSSAAA